MNTARAVKISLAWICIAWTVCYLAFGLIPELGRTATPYVVPLENIFTVGNFVIGLIVWNVVAAAGVALAGLLSNIIKG